MQMISIYLVLLLKISEYLSLARNNESLISLHILFRHGERSPKKTYTNDPHANYTWPGGWEQLSNRGKHEMYSLGKRLRHEYGSFLPEYYMSDDVYVLSSYADRCVMSAQLLLAGLYPPVKEQIWNPDLLWQPIPVNSVPRNLDNKLALKRNCPKYAEALKNAYNSDKMKTLNANSKQLYEYLSKCTGDLVNDILTVEILYNTLEIQTLNNLTLPSWTQGVYPDQMKNLAALSLAIFTDTDFMKRMHGGALLSEILTHMQQKRDGQLKPNRKLFLYSGHDLSIVSLLRILGFDELMKPEFGASVILEQHYDDGKHTVKILYKRNPSAEAVVKELPGCKEQCLLEDFKVLMSKYLVGDWEEECKL